MNVRANVVTGELRANIVTGESKAKVVSHYYIQMSMIVKKRFKVVIGRCEREGKS